MTKVIAHRGAPVEAPENTLASFQRGLSAGCHMLELDVRLTKDNKLAVIHDATVDRTTHGTGEVASLTWTELRALSANKGFEDQFPDETIPSLDEVFDLADDDMLVNIEIKTVEASDVKTADTLLKWINSSGIDHERLLISCFHRPAILHIVAHAPHLETAIPFKKVPDDFDSLPFGTVHPRHDLVDAEFMARARSAGKRVNVWTVDEAAEQIRLLQLGVDGIMTNDPRALVSLRTSL